MGGEGCGFGHLMLLEHHLKCDNTNDWPGEEDAGIHGDDPTCETMIIHLYDITATQQKSKLATA